MAGVISYSYVNLAEAMKREGYDDVAAVLGELAEMIDLLDVIPWLPTTHGPFNRQLQAARLGNGQFAEYNGPIATITSDTEIVEEPVKLYEGESIVDERLLEGLDGEAAYAVRDSEDILCLEGAFQDWSYNLFYGNLGTPNIDNFTSMAQRRYSPGSQAPYVFSAGGSGSTLTSAWILECSPQTFYLGYPANVGTPGLHNEDRGLQRVLSPTGSGMMYAWCRLYRIQAAIIMRNARSIMRYCNIASSGASNTFSITDFVRYIKNQLQFMGRNAFIFVNRYVKGEIEGQAYKDTQNGALTVQAVEGYGPVTYVAGIPVRMHEGIPITESALS
jgi:hypothetical protein